MKINKVLFVIVFVLIALFMVSPVGAAGNLQGETPASPNVAELDGEFLFFLITLTGFLKERFNVHGNLVLGVAFFVGLFLYLQPMYLPEAGVVNIIVSFVQWFLGAAGTIDTGKEFATAVGKGMALAKNAPKG